MVCGQSVGRKSVMKTFPTVEPHFQRRHVSEREVRGGGSAIGTAKGAETDGFDRAHSQADSGADVT